MLVAAGIVFLGAVAMLLIGYIRRDTRGLPFLGESEKANVGLVIGFGIAVPVVVLVALFIVSDLYVLGKTDAPPVSSTAMTVVVVGHQWWWEAKYPASEVTTANEIHIPARTSVNILARTADVIHSFWVPELNRKIDMIPGQSNRVELYAERPGVYRGQCAEFCGLQHAHMAFEVVAEPRPRFERWLATQKRPARAPATPLGERGEGIFMENACSGCHTIAGTAAEGTIGPNLTHLASRSTLAALTIPNDRRELGRWIRDPQSVKPGTKMPGLQLSSSQFHAIATYLSELR